MDPFPVRFSISDLENLSGVKAQTIRMWERRYQLLSPDRTGTNIRDYGLEELKTILNVAYLNGQGVKISKLAAMTRGQLGERVQELSSNSTDGTSAINALKVAMLTYDSDFFEEISSGFEKREGFRGLVEKLYIPLMRMIGLLWQANSVCPAQEHFVSNLIRSRIIGAIGSIGTAVDPNSTTHVLYLPESEIHELGILYVHYLLRAGGNRVIFLGQSVPQEDLVTVAQQLTGRVRFISIFTTHPRADDLGAYVARLRSTMPDERVSFVLCGSKIAAARDLPVVPGVVFVPELQKLVSTIL